MAAIEKREPLAKPDSEVAYWEYQSDNRAYWGISLLRYGEFPVKITEEDYKKIPFKNAAKEFVARVLGQIPSWNLAEGEVELNKLIDDFVKVKGIDKDSIMPFLVTHKEYNDLVESIEKAKVKEEPVVAEAPAQPAQ